MSLVAKPHNFMPTKINASKVEDLSDMRKIKNKK